MKKDFICQKKLSERLSSMIAGTRKGFSPSLHFCPPLSPLLMVLAGFANHFGLDNQLITGPNKGFPEAFLQLVPILHDMSRQLQSLQEGQAHFSQY
jgi:hypothetical protein